ncbi:CBP80/20-dependent translation initiation factor isoform X1 [Amyelois transitella]|uniref:CBP80/20-dependent translation initiation factor isoform X1 n=1 Tax=Amyelois transitella TaxID=680683 RepID=UPI00067D35E2|nr:CBP80/20-dependent translation initiation factor isoform X1 [Amyelois transitella]XP_060803145.1 CBP80/20-dependent translation initiation factor isoform X1 [Amyelois transitella]
MQTQIGVGNELQRSYRMQDFASPGVIMRERSFIRPQSHHNMHHHNQFPNNGKRRSMILTNAKGKPTLEIYRPPGVRTEGVSATTATATTAGGQNSSANKLNVHAKEFTMAKPVDLHNRSAMGLGYASVGLQHSRSAVLHAQVPPHYRPVLPSSAMVNTCEPAQQAGPRVHFKLQPQNMSEKKKSPPSSLINGNGKSIRPQLFTPGLKRSKSLTSADTLASGMAALGLAADAGDLGNFPPDIQECIDKALEDPNAVTARTLMDAVGHLVSRAVESPRYALPAARRCIAVVEREQTETFLESLLNTCQQWYHDREKLLGAIVGGGRPRLMAFLSFLLEMYCQLRRRAIQRRGAAQPSHVLLALICKCCEDCIRQPVPSASDTENLFFVLTYIGRDLESQLPGDLERLLSSVRDAFLNTNAAPSIRRTLLQLIELHASRWQLPGCAVLYYYPSSK